MGMVPSKAALGGASLAPLHPVFATACGEVVQSRAVRSVGSRALGLMSPPTPGLASLVPVWAPAADPFLQTRHLPSACRFFVFLPLLVSRRGG